MSCQNCSEAMMRFFDGNLNDIETAQMKQHLKTCQKCSDEFESLNSILCVLETDSIIEPPQDFEEQVMAKINGLEPESKKNFRVLVYGIPIVLVISLSMLITARFMGGMAFDAVEQLVGSSTPLADFLTTMFNIVNALYTVLSELVNVVLQVSLVLIKTYYYLIIMLASMLFAIQWMLVMLVRQNHGGVAR